tara:strand:+ start:3621 stop:6566 length:2946 start_codon:yes stop_codon:yes gene_type:complete
MTTTYKKKLIEVSIPLEAINAASAHEKMPGIGPHPRGIHLWWARRPLAACRAVLFAQLVDDPSEYADELLEDAKLRRAAEKELAERLAKRQRDKEEGKAIPAEDKPVTLEDVIVDLERQRLFKIIQDMVKWENSTNEEVLERARAEIRRSCNGKLPSIYDPFSGGGSIPLEAQRLGLSAYGSDLNPVAVMIGKAMIEIPPKFKDQPPIHPGPKERTHYRNAEGLAEDVKYYGKWMRDKAFERIGALYPQIDLPKEYGGGKATVIAWIWARTVPCPDPAFANVQVPVVSSFVLSTKKRKEAWIEPIVDKKLKSITWRVHSNGTKAELEKAKKGTKAGRAVFRCLFSDAPITGEYADAEAAKGNMGKTLIAIVADSKNGRVYVSPESIEQEKAVLEAETLLAKMDLGHLELPCRGTFASNAQGRRYGFNTFKDYYNDRQLVSLNTFRLLMEDARAEVEKDAIAVGLSSEKNPLRNSGTGARAYAEAISVYLEFGIERCTDFNNSVVRWSPSNEKVMNLFARQAIPMTWDFPEANILSKVVGGFEPCIEFISKCISTLPANSSGQIYAQDAQSVSYDPNVVISTDPPYYDNVSYADLSDFFFCWMRVTLRSLYPELLGVLAAPKAEELIADSYRQGDKDAAEAFFLDGMRRAITRMAEQSSEEFPATIYYAFKQSEIDKEGISSTGWATFLQAVIEAGYAVVGTWPVRSEQTYRMVAAGTNALANSVVLVCRQRQADAGVISRAEFIRALKRELPPAIAELQRANIAPADMPQSSIGPGMGIYSRYASILEADDSPMTVKAALQLINRELDEFLSDVQGEFDSDTRFSITWFGQHGYDKGESGSAINIAQARGISVESVKHAGIIEYSAGKVRILKRDEFLDDWDPATDAHLTVWECCQHLIRKLETEGEYEAAILLKKIGPDKSDAVKDLAYCLYDICSNKRKDAKEATSYNALIAIWAELTRQAASIHENDLGGDRQTAMNL